MTKQIRNILLTPKFQELKNKQKTFINKYNMSKNRDTKKEYMQKIQEIEKLIINETKKTK